MKQNGIFYYEDKSLLPGTSTEKQNKSTVDSVVTSLYCKTKIYLLCLMSNVKIVFKKQKEKFKTSNTTYKCPE